MPKVRAIVFHAHGVPEEVARCAEIELPDCGPTEARVRVLAAPINPADLNVIEGKYPLRPTLPGVPGVEGAALVEEVGAEVANMRAGEMVLLPHGFGTWREAGVVEAKRLRVIPPGIPAEQAAMLKINPATALRMISDFHDLRAGDWLMQNAANSGVGRAVIRVARSRGLRTVNVVRRAELVGELKSEGADVVLLDDDSLRDAIAAAIGGAEIRLALNAVGGESALRLANALAPGGTLVTYGAMGRQPVRVPNALLIFRDVRFAGFWVSRWYEHASAAAQDEMFTELFALAQRGELTTPVEKTYALSEVHAALRHAQQSQRAGKILFVPTTSQ